MKTRWDLVARPRSTISRPVANGSRVPAWPVLTPPSARRTLATTSWELIPRGLSISRTPSTAPAPARPLGDRFGGLAAGKGVALRLDLRAQELDQGLEAEVGREARGARVPASALCAGDDRHVDLV